MAELITMTFFGSVWVASTAFGALLRAYAPAATRQAEQIEIAGLTTAALGGITLWLFFTINGVTAAG